MSPKDYLSKNAGVNTSSSTNLDSLPNDSSVAVSLDKKFLDKIVNDEPWKIALRLNLLSSDEGSRFKINSNLDKYSSLLKDTLGEEKFRELNGVVAYANSMMLDFESALPYALVENNLDSLLLLEENALLYGRSDVVSSIDAYGRKNGLIPLIIDTNDMQNFLIYHALPQIRLCANKDKKYTYKLDSELLNGILDKITVGKKNALYLALNVLEEKSNKNIFRKLIFANILEDKPLVDKYVKELKEKYYTPRDSIDSIVKERAIFLDQGELSRLQFGDDNPIFPIASNIFLVNGYGSKKVWKEDLKLYTDFSRLDGYSSEKEILSDLDHPNIIKLLGTFSEKNINFLELEYAQGKSLDKYSNLSEKEVLGITINLCDVLNYLHSKNVVYMDMKQKNIMYNRPEEKVLADSKYDLEAIAKNVKLLDFGMSQKKENLNASTTLTTLLSTPEYLSAELTGFRSSIATDTFQLGLLLHNMIYKNHAFVDESLKLKEGDNFRESEVLMYGLAVKFSKYSPLNDSYGLLLSKMLEKEPAKRPDLNYVKNELMNIYSSKFDIASNSESVYIAPDINIGNSLNNKSLEVIV